MAAVVCATPEHAPTLLRLCADGPDRRLVLTVNPQCPPPKVPARGGDADAAEDLLPALSLIHI